MRKIHTKSCEQCGETFYKASAFESAKKFYSRRFCSLACVRISPSWRRKISESNKGRVPWNRGKHGLQVAWNKGNGDYAKKLCFGKWMLGKKQSIETLEKKSKAAKAMVARGEHNFYIDGRTKVNQSIRRSYQYRLWREAVFARDNYTCQECGIRCGDGKKVVLNADHIKPFAYYPELRFELSNGRTLCIDCHKKTDTYMGRALKHSFVTHSCPH